METLGGLIDKLSVVNIRIWFAEDIKRNKNASDKQIVDACRITNVANSQRNDLIQEIDELINSMILSGKPQRLYKQGDTKLYGGNVNEFSKSASNLQEIDYANNQNLDADAEIK